MNTALRLTKLDAGGLPLVNIDFSEQEIITAEVASAQKSRVDRAQNGQPTLYVLGDDWTTISVQFHVHEDDTLAKLNTVRNAVKSGSLFRIHPGMVDEPSLYYDCFVQPNWAAKHFGAGRYRSGDVFSLLFIEASKAGQVSMGTGFYV